MIYTSYFGNLQNLPDTITPVAICGGIPEWYTGLWYKKLAPKWSFFKVWKETHDNDYYVENFSKLVLNTLCPYEVVKELVELAGSGDIALICYEKPGDFCHRHLVAEWLNKYDIKCEEYQED